MLRANLLSLPMKRSGTFIENLQTIATYVALAGFGVAGDDAWQRDEAAGIFGPALEDRKPVQRKIIFPEDFFAWAVADCFRKELSHLREHRKHLHFVEKALWGFDVHEVADAIGNLV